MMQRMLSAVCLSLFLMSAPAAAAQPVQAGGEYLSPGVPVERELKGGEAHSYEETSEAEARRLFVEPEVSCAADVLEATTFFQLTDSGATT